MRYFVLDKGNNFETGDVYPQSQIMGCGYMYNAPNSLRNLPMDEFPDFEPNLNCFILHHKAKPTDIISATSLYTGLLMSDRLRTVFLDFKIDAYKFYPAVVTKREKKWDYHLFLTISKRTVDINLQKSEFYLRDFTRKPLETVRFSTIDELDSYTTDAVNKVHDVGIKQIVFKKTFDKELDLFRFSVFNYQYIISERLKHAIEALGATGIEFYEIDENKIVFE
jgi:hypothetical protein